VTEREHNPDGWTFATLYKHVEKLSEASKEAINAAITAAQKAVDKAEGAQQLRNDAQNEWRGAMKDQQSTFADKEQTERRLSAIEKWQAAQGGKDKGVGISTGVMVQVITSAAAAATIIGVLIATRH
jgi:hypothetical protein